MWSCSEVVLWTRDFGSKFQIHRHNTPTPGNHSSASPKPTAGTVATEGHPQMSKPWDSHPVALGPSLLAVLSTAHVEFFVLPTSLLQSESLPHPQAPRSFHWSWHVAIPWSLFKRRPLSGTLLCVLGLFKTWPDRQTFLLNFSQAHVADNWLPVCSVWALLLPCLQK